MKCEFCGEENSANAIFCKKCGHSLDGKKVCPSCGKLIPLNDEYCIFCGHKAKKTSSEKKKQVLSIISFISSCLAIICSLIFTFLIGVATQVNGEIPNINMLSFSFNIYYYFYDAYDQLKNSDIFAYGLIGPLLGTITVLITIIGMLITLAFSIKAIVAYAKKLNTSITKYAIFTYFIYLGGVILFMMNTAINISSLELSLVLNINSTTIAGIIVGGVFVLTTSILDIINRKISGTIKDYIYRAIIGIFTVIISLVAFSFLSREIITIAAENATGGMGISLYSWIIFESISKTYPFSDSTINNFIGSFTGITILCTAIVILSIIFIISLMFIIKDIVTNFGSNFKGTAIMHVIDAGICLIFIGIWELILGLVLTPYFVKENVTINVIIPTILIVLGSILFAISIIVPLIFKRKKIS